MDTNQDFYHQEECARCHFAFICENRAEQKKESFVKRIKPIKKNEYLQKENQPFRHIYAVRAGAVKAYQIEGSGKIQISDLFVQGEIIGLDAIHHEKYPYSTIALKDSLLCEIPYAHLLDEHLDIATYQHIFSIFSARLNLNVYLSYVNAEKKLANFLLRLTERLHQQDDILHLPMTQYDIANYLRLTSETISRIFKSWQKNGIIKKIKNREIELQSLALANLINVNIV